MRRVEHPIRYSVLSALVRAVFRKMLVVVANLIRNVKLNSASTLEDN